MVLSIGGVFASAARVFSLVLVAGGQMLRQTLHSLVWGVLLVAAFGCASERSAMTLAAAYAYAFGAFLLLQTFSGGCVLRARPAAAPHSP
jgi:uncharacterized membrane protein (UPF0136 family)